ncbi:type I restriction-modification system subunit M [Elizabethkingia miricola]|uniref:site-specific DNA-methyltransferase (adenine-specific) n=1 Tax=Elizabethkingia miricola TaxID=172045 RepID=A0ABD5B255_ELIMR|nr:type I restriction-modification system subunit M [Elizabethkingia miricola]MDQ8747864.1 type I restriction-modification system subunit M [Elizabethkingia miricola]MPS75024.1 type I restriction-modification system subunit M [Chryseobacterium sp.]
MSNKVSQKDINNTVWKACDTFRGTIDPSQYKDYILTMLFLKYVTDVYNEKKEEYAKKYEGNEERVKRALERERFIVPEESSFYFLYENRNNPKIGEMINHALAELEEANREKLGGHDGSNIFRNIDFNSSNLGDAKGKLTRLRNLLNDFYSLNLSSSHLESNDVIGGAYEFLIANFASDSGKKAGEFFTPAEVSTLLAKLTKSKPGSRIYDPTCGSGSLLIKAGRQVGDNNFSLYGQEANGSTWALAVMNMYLHGYDSAVIRWGDTLRNPKHKEGEGLMLFDTVVANPPFSLDKWGADDLAGDHYNRFWRGLPPKSKGDWAFISHMIESLNNTGKAGVVVPHGVLFRGAAEGKIRTKMIEEDLIEAVIGLPSNLFFGTSIPAAILIFNKQKVNKEKVLFVDASKDFVSGKNQNSLGEKHIQHITDVFTQFHDHTMDKGIVEERFAYIASFEEIRENDFNLNIPRYVDTFEPEAEIDIQEVMQEIKSLEAKRDELDKEINMYLKELGIDF